MSNTNYIIENEGTLFDRSELCAWRIKKIVHTIEEELWPVCFI